MERRFLPVLSLLRKTALAAAGLLAGGAAQAQSELYVDPASTTVAASERLEGQARRDALRLARFPSASWFTDGTPGEVRRRAARLVDAAAAKGQVPVLVAYNIPGRDCSHYSAGGAAGTEHYLEWIAGLAAGIGERPAIVVVEPDSLGVIPWFRNLSGAIESCRPDGQAPDGAAEARFAQLRGAADILAELPRARFYLDGTGSNWLPPGEAADRLLRAGIAQADGFFLNVSNFESDRRLLHYARWVSDCIALATARAVEPAECPSQYGPASFENDASWAVTDAAYDRLFAGAGLAADPATQKRAILDTSRNGRGSWTPPAGAYADPEIWCNPPGRGLGRRPTLATDHAYVDAFLWIKIPGESDGACHRGTAGPTDPERGIIAPRAGAWFAEQARELILLAAPPLAED